MTAVSYVCNTIVRESWYMCKNDVKSGLMDVTCDSADKGNWPYNRKLTPKIPSNYTKPSSTLYYFKLWTSLQCEEVSEVLTATLNCRTPALSLKITRSKQPIWLNWPCQLVSWYVSLNSFVGFENILVCRIWKHFQWGYFSLSFLCQEYWLQDYGNQGYSLKYSWCGRVSKNVHTII